MIRRSVIYCHLIDFFFEKMECPVCHCEAPGLCALCYGQLVPWGRFSHSGIRGTALFHYSGIARRLIYAYKKSLLFTAREGLELALTEWLKGNSISEFDFIVPVTSGHENRKLRGFDPAVVLAEHLSRESGVPLANCVRNVGKRESKEQRRAERYTCANERFRIKLKERQSLAGKKVLVFDDIMTTGASIRSVTEKLLALGVVRVEFLVIARATAK